jgi:hypothetical protein
MCSPWAAWIRQRPGGAGFGRLQVFVFDSFPRTADVRGLLARPASPLQPGFLHSANHPHQFLLLPDIKYSTQTAPNGIQCGHTAADRARNAAAEAAEAVASARNAVISPRQMPTTTQISGLEASQARYSGHSITSSQIWGAAPETAETMQSARSPRPSHRSTATPSPNPQSPTARSPASSRLTPTALRMHEEQNPPLPVWRRL